MKLNKVSIFEMIEQGKRESKCFCIYSTFNLYTFKISNFSINPINKNYNSNS